MTVAVYCIINPRGQVYVGGTTNYEKRIYHYTRMLEKKQVRLYESFCKYGVEAHSFKVLQVCTKRDLHSLERCWGEFLGATNPDKGLNSALPAGPYKKGFMSIEVRAKIGNFHRGKKLALDHRAKISAFMKDRRQTRDHIEKRKMFGSKNPAYGKPSAFRGRKHDDKTKALLSSQRLGIGKLGENSNAKKVLDKETGKIFSCAKEVSTVFGINYSTLKAWLQKRNKGDDRFEYYEKTKLS